MDLYKVISELHELLRQVDEAIANLEMLDRAKGLPTRRKRGRPPKNAGKEKGPIPKE
jgi:hypothetical protein